MINSQVDWDEVTKQTLYDVLGEPLAQRADILYWAGKSTTRGDNSRSFTYTLSGDFAGHWHDWSESVGGKSVFKFLQYWHGWDKKQSVEYLKSTGALSDATNADFVPTQKWRENKHQDRKKEWNAKRKVKTFGDAIVRSPVAFQKAFNEAWVKSLKEEERERGRKLIGNAWADVQDKMLESLLILSEQVDDKRVDIALQTLCTARSYCMEVLGEHHCFPEIKGGATNEASESRNDESE